MLPLLIAELLWRELQGWLSRPLLQSGQYLGWAFLYDKLTHPLEIQTSTPSSMLILYKVFTAACCMSPVPLLLQIPNGESKRKQRSSSTRAARPFLGANDSFAVLTSAEILLQNRLRSGATAAGPGIKEIPPRIATYRT